MRIRAFDHSPEPLTDFGSDPFDVQKLEVIANFNFAGLGKERDLPKSRDRALSKCPSLVSTSLFRRFAITSLVADFSSDPPPAQMPVTDFDNDLLDTQTLVTDFGSDLLDTQKPVIDFGSDIPDVQKLVTDFGSDPLDVQKPVPDFGNDLPDSQTTIPSSVQDPLPHLTKSIFCGSISIAQQAPLFQISKSSRRIIQIQNSLVIPGLQTHHDPETTAKISPPAISKRTHYTVRPTDKRLMMPHEEKSLGYDVVRQDACISWRRYLCSFFTDGPLTWKCKTVATSTSAVESSREAKRLWETSPRDTYAVRNPQGGISDWHYNWEHSEARRRKED